ncbi:MAG: DMT family transporter [Thermodesulfobacteriota bacterium]
MPPSKSLFWPLAGLVMASLIWASSFVAFKLTFRSYAPMQVVFARMAIGSFCLFLMRGRFRGLEYRPGDWKPLLFMAFCEPCLYFIFETWALLNTTASQVGMITALLPLMVAVTARFVLNERLTGRTIVGFVLAVGGAAWLSAGGLVSEQAPNPALGNFLEFLAMICAVGYTVMIKKLSHRYSPLFLTAVQNYVGMIFFLPLVFVPPLTWPDRIDLLALAATVYLGTVVTIGAFVLYSFGVSRIKASQASAFINLIPVFAAGLGWLILGETFTRLQYMASLVVLVGVFLSQSRKR